MIFYSDGIFPLWGFIVIFIVFYALRKEAKENKKIDNEIAVIQNEIKEIDKLGEMLNKGETIIKKSDFKYLKDKDFAGYVGVKFV